MARTKADRHGDTVGGPEQQDTRARTQGANAALNHGRNTTAARRKSHEQHKTQGPDVRSQRKGTRRIRGQKHLRAQKPRTWKQKKQDLKAKRTPGFKTKQKHSSSYLSKRLSQGLARYLPNYLASCLAIHLLSVDPSIHPSVYLSIRLSI